MLEFFYLVVILLNVLIVFLFVGCLNLVDLNLFFVYLMVVIVELFVIIS